ncbi:cytochrome p450 monooxygenase [Podospora didyma]|uniref:Cytochrome p450 monooxygenase n=1 Tax=Podospora didyma TaxID=330526 RepID=A0AAE0NS88_9PEZI|nr:cytochrome p450 monooxygenase [Podospora didyma]
MQTHLHLAASLAATFLLVPIRNICSTVALKTFGATACLILASRAAYSLWIYPNYVSPLRHLPGPKNHHFLFRQFINEFRSRDPNEPFLSWTKKWPDAEMIRYFPFGAVEAILVTGVTPLREIVSINGYSFVKPQSLKTLLEPMVGTGLVFSEGAEHKAARHLLSGPFALSKLRELIPVFQHKAQQLLASFDRQIEKQGGVVELVSTYSNLMLDIIGAAALGVELKNLEVPTPFFELYEEMNNPPPLGKLFMAINAFIPVAWIPLDVIKRLNNASQEVRRLLRAIIQQRVQDVTEKGVGGLGRRDLLTYMVEETHATENTLSEEEILGHILNFIAGGHDTSASSLTWATYAMIKYPVVQDRLRAEITTMLDQTPVPGYSELEDLKYLDSFCKEVLRVWAPATSSPREAAHDILINGVLVPKGTLINLMPAAIHFNPRVWGDDAEEFNPDRWSRKSIDPHAFVTFFRGPRQCIGRVYSMIQFKVLLVQMVSKFRFEAIETETEKKMELLTYPTHLLRPVELEVRVGRLG